MRKLVVPIVLATCIWFSSCYEETISTDPSLKLSFSVDTLLFDTVFTSIGSATRYFKVYNNSNGNLRISSVRLSGGSSSPYRMNVDGEATRHARDITLRGKDSLFVFVEVTVDPTDLNSPLLIPDSIIFETNGNFQDVKLMAWGQDVHLLNKTMLTESTLFTADKPYLVYNHLYVGPNATLTIEAGTKLHFHNQSWLVVDGTIIANGEPTKPIIFEGDRLESFYRDKAGQWGGIWLTQESQNNFFDWTEIRNAISGFNIYPYARPNASTLVINNSKIYNISYMAIDARGANIQAGNCLFANSAEVGVTLSGGTYGFYHCTFANYWNQYISRKGPMLLLSNYYLNYDYETESVVVVPDNLDEANFANCIIYGSRENELEIVTSYFGQPFSTLMNYFFENTILRVSDKVNLNDISRFKNVLTDNPKFKDPFKNIFELDTLSPAKDIGLLNIANLFPVDLKNVSRLNDQGPDLGAFERIE